MFKTTLLTAGISILIGVSAGYSQSNSDASSVTHTEVDTEANFGDNPYTNGHGLQIHGIKPVTCYSDIKPECQEQNSVTLPEFIEASSGLHAFCNIILNQNIDIDVDTMLMCTELNRMHNLND